MSNSKFDIRRALLNAEDDNYEPLYISEPIPLKEALRQGLIQPSSPAQAFQLNDKTYVFSLNEMIYYHVAQIKDEPSLMLTHCAVCNGGACFSPVVDGVYHHFFECGLYDSMTIIKDEETGSIWHHITGECLHGPMKGKKLASYGTAMITTFGQALQNDPNALLVSEQLDEEQSEEMMAVREAFSGDMAAGWEYTKSSVLVEDNRLPRMTMGLGVWTEDDVCFYPLHTLNQQYNVTLDQINGRQTIVFVNQSPQFPRAFYTDSQSVEVVRGQIRLSNGWSIQDGLIYNNNHEIVTPEYPRQVFARWFGFSLSFPNCRIYQ